MPFLSLLLQFQSVTDQKLNSYARTHPHPLTYTHADTHIAPYITMGMQIALSYLYQKYIFITILHAQSSFIWRCDLSRT